MNITTNQNTSFLITSETGDILPSGEQGFYDADTRFLSDYRFLISNKKFKKLTGRPVNYYSSVHYLTNPALDGIKEATIKVGRNQLVGDGMHEDIDVTNFNSKTVTLTLKMISKSDFADIFEVKSRKIKKKLKVSTRFDRQKKTMNLVHKSKGFYRETRIKLTKLPTRVLKNGLLWELHLKPKETWRLCCDILPLTSPEAEIERPKYRCGEFGLIKIGKTGGFEEFQKKVATIDTDYITLQQAYEQSVDDLASLRLAGRKEGEVPAAGIPWFMTYFGRDSLITALQNLLIAPSIAKGVLQALSQYQGQKVDNRSEEEPGKILHEVRFGRLATNIGAPLSVYYGSIDATLLFIILLYEYHLYSGDESLLRQMTAGLKKALSWIDNYGDKDKDGYVEYERKNKEGLFNQGWKDSGDGVAFSDGTIPKPPIALCEVQGYLYDARLKASVLLRIIGENKLANKHEKAAIELKKKFNQDFWMKDKNFFAQALDKNKKQVDSITSNPGHLLWSSILDKEKAKIVADRLLAEEFFTGWGVRTLSEKEIHYNPISYHNGTVWPHDNSIIAGGLINYGFSEHAHRVISGIIQSSKYFAYTRLPELFCGFNQKETLVPIEYPTSNSPQAWAAGSIPSMLTAMLRITIDPESKKEITISPNLLPKINKLVVKGLSITGQKVDLAINKKGEKVVTEVLNNPSLEIKIR